MSTEITRCENRKHLLLRRVGTAGLIGISLFAISLREFGELCVAVGDSASVVMTPDDSGCQKEKQMQKSKSPYTGEQEAAALIGMTVFALRRWRQLGVGPAYIRLRGRRGRILYERAELLRFVRQYTVTTSESTTVGGAR